jgi:hypothetical protein
MNYDDYRRSAQRRLVHKPAAPTLRRQIADVAHGILIGAAILAVGYTAVGYTQHWRHPAVARTATYAPAMQPARLMPAPAMPGVQFAQFNGTLPTADVKQVADWVADSRDNRGKPFAILDKSDARVYVFDSGAHLIGASPVLLGAAVGDDSAPGIGQKAMTQVRQQEKTTPAGRFESHPGRNASGEHVVWVDYADAVSMHRVRPVDPKERRLQRLASANPADRRISYGCINVPVAFFDMVVHPMLETSPGVVYVLPETRPLHTAFGNLYDVSDRQALRDAPAPRLQAVASLSPRT